MIISYPTALYLSVIPQTASNSGNVTYTISMTSPPYGSLVEVQLPAAIAQRQRSAIDTTKPDGQLTKRTDNTKMNKYLPNFKFTPLEIGLTKTIKWIESNYPNLRGL